MGKFTYDSSVSIGFDDRALAHLQAVILAKVRRGEGFAFMWKDDMSLGGGRTSVYIHARSTMAFAYDAGRTPVLSRAWLDVLTHAANSSSGLHLVPEPGGQPLDASAALRQASVAAEAGA